MKKIYILGVLMLLIVALIPVQTRAQNSVTLTFTCQTTYGGFLQPDSITIVNLTRNWTETIYYPDTVYTLNVETSVPNHPIDNGMQVMPNPFDGFTRIRIQSPKTENVKITLTDMGGRVCAEYNGMLQKGVNQFSVSLSIPQTYVLTVRSSSGIRSLKMENVGHSGSNSILYEGEANINKPMVQLKSSSSHPFELGDEMRYQGFTTIHSTPILSQEVTHAQNADETIVLVFPSTEAEIFTCGTDTVVDYDGNVYTTVKIGQQCWMKENLRTTHYSDGTEIAAGSTGSDTEAYYYIPEGASAAYGYLYNWKAVMNNSSSSTANPSGVQGICPTGWHVPSDAEWTKLTDYVGTRSEYACDSNNLYIAKALAATMDWISSTDNCTVGNDQSSNNVTGFDALPVGEFMYSYGDGNFGHHRFGEIACFWSATEASSYYAWFRILLAGSAIISRSNYSKAEGHSVRCLQNRDSTQTALPTVTTSAATNIMTTLARLNATFTNLDDIIISAKGFEWRSANDYTYQTIAASGTVSTFTSILTELTANTAYTYRAFITVGDTTIHGDEITFTTSTADTILDGQPCPSAPTLTDYDSNVYITVQIGQQCWMKENLRTTHYSDGTAISEHTGINYPSVAYYYIPGGAFAYGYLYNGVAVMHGMPSSSINPSGVQGICPTGWHVPSNAEWTQLINYTGAQNEYVCGSNNTYIAKALAAPSGWKSSLTSCAVGNDQSSNNATDFFALPAGSYDWGLSGFGYFAYFWSATEDSIHRLGTYCLGYNLSTVSFYYTSGDIGGRSVRCLRDPEGDGTDSTQAFLPTVTTSAIADITATSASCGGAITADGGADVTARGVCWSTTPNPTIDDSHTTDGLGIGTFTSNLDNLTENTTYFVRAYATNSVGIAYGNEVSFTTEADTFTCGTDTVVDYDGNVYSTVQIGIQCWMAENLRTSHYSNGTAIALSSSSSSTVPRRYNPDGNASNVSTYGYLYNWSAVMNGSATSNTNPSEVQGICPNSWHVPSDAEWTQLTDYVSSQSQYLCSDNTEYIAKALASTMGWVAISNQCSIGNQQNSNNATGFSALPAGEFNSYVYLFFGKEAGFWSTTEGTVTAGPDIGTIGAWGRGLYFEDAYVIRTCATKSSAFSVRCLKN